jgi:hypothetical protein
MIDRARFWSTSQLFIYFCPDVPEREADFMIFTLLHRPTP